MDNQSITLLDVNGEKVLISTFVGDNRDKEVLDYHKKVFEFYGISNNYFNVNFGYGYGNLINNLIRQTLHVVDYYLFFDMDAIPLKKEGVLLILDKIRDKMTIWGISQQSNHIKKNGTFQHAYAGFSSCGFSKELYIKLGSPTFSETERGDIGEELTWKCEELGYNVCLSYPTEFHELTEEEMAKSGNPKNWIVNNGIKYGLGTTFGGIYYHSFMQDVPRSNTIFIQKCCEIIGETNQDKKIEAIIVCKNYGDYLELTLAENHKYFDNIIIVTDSEDIQTQDICKKYPNVNCWYFTEWNKNGAKFNFGGARQFGLSKLKYQDWICIMDGDLIIREDFNNKLIDKTKFYGSYRRFINKYSDYKDLINGVKLQEDFTDVREGSGNGFLQIFNYNHPTIKTYGLDRLYEDSYSATETDIIFLRKFCPFINNEYYNLIRMNIETWHLGVADAQHNLGRNATDSFFNNQL